MQIIKKSEMNVKRITSGKGLLETFRSERGDQSTSGFCTETTHPIFASKKYVSNMSSLLSHPEIENSFDL
jgi:hypothetical protein